MVGPYCAFLRGVNVNGRNMKMVELCEIFRSAGMEDVSAVLATGNVLFRSELPVGELRDVLCGAVSAHYGYDASIFIRDRGQVAAMVSSLPYEQNALFHVYAFVCEPGVPEVLMEAFKGVKAAPGESVAVNEGLFYWRVQKGETLNAGFSKALGGKEYRDKFTSRNINTIYKVLSRLERMG